MTTSIHVPFTPSPQCRSCRLGTAAQVKVCRSKYLRKTEGFDGGKEKKEGLRANITAAGEKLRVRQCLRVSASSFVKGEVADRSSWQSLLATPTVQCGF